MNDQHVNAPMRRLDRRAVLGLGLLTGLSTALAGCGKNADSTVAGTATTNAAAAAASTTQASEPTVTTPEQALSRLTAGNDRFAAGTVRHPDQNSARRTELAAGQHPYAIVFSCVDSRVPPELVFDEGLGDLFVIRSAGHVVDHAVLGSLQYGVAELKIPLLMVMGHEKCGAVKATVEAVEKKSAATGTDIDALITAIRPAVQQAEAKHPTDLLDASIRANTTEVVSALSGKAILKDALGTGKLRIVGSRYDLDTGKVELV